MLFESSLRRISARERDILAWVVVDPRPPLGDGPLRGIPFGVKDIYETKDMLTEYGSPLYAGRVGTRDAAVVEHLRCKGAVLVGKTRTAAFASFDPPATRNPAAMQHSPGGSSSGSAAAVADGMVPFALGTQTLGSVLRPASYCGICGFKPTYGRLPTTGILPFAPSLDTVGLFTEDAADMEVLWALAFQDAGLVARPPVEEAAEPGWFASEPAPELAQMIGNVGWLKALRKAAGEGIPLTAPVRLSGGRGWPPTAHIEIHCEPDMRQEMRRTVQTLRMAGMRIDPLPPPPGYDSLLRSVLIVNDYEGARSHQERWRTFGAHIGPKLAELVQRGLAIPERDYRTALDAIRRMKGQIAAVLRNYPLLIVPAATGAAPEGLKSTGDPSANAVWTALGLPAISIPMKVPAGALPLGMQMIAAWNEDEALLAAAVQCSATI